MRDRNLPGMNTGIFSLPMAARIVRIPTDRLRAWVRGRSKWSGRDGSPHGPVFAGAHESLTFADILELRVVKALLDDDATFPNIRQAHARYSAILDSPYPFIEGEGLQVLDRGVVAPIDHEILNLSKGQYLLRYVTDYLKDVRFEGGNPVSLKPMGEGSPVVIDARIRFGDPTVEGTRVPTADVYDLWVAEEKDRSVVARAYGLSEAQVSGAIEYEERRRAPWAA